MFLTDGPFTKSICPALPYPCVFCRQIALCIHKPHASPQRTRSTAALAAEPQGTSHPLRGVMRHSPLLVVRSEPLWEKNLLKPADGLALFKLGAKTLPASQACTAALPPPWPAGNVPPVLQLCSSCPDTTHLYSLYLKRPLKQAIGRLSHPSEKS